MPKIHVYGEIDSPSANTTYYIPEGTHFIVNVEGTSGMLTFWVWADQPIEVELETCTNPANGDWHGIANAILGITETPEVPGFKANKWNYISLPDIGIYYLRARVLTGSTAPSKIKWQLIVW